MARNKHPSKKARLSKAGTQTKWAPFWTVPKIYGKGKIVSAKIVTQKEFDEEYKKIKVDFIRNIAHELDIETLEKMIDVIPNMSQANTKRISRFD